MKRAFRFFRMIAERSRSDRRRIARALERLVALYEMDLESRGLTLPEPGRKDEVELVYGEQPGQEEEEEPV